MRTVDFINATNNSVSGIIYVRDKQLYPGHACAFNGWLGQLSVQATDISVLAISTATLLVVTQTTRVASKSTLVKVLLCLSVWVLPIITSTTALAMGAIVPVSGNWCWISSDRTDLRYALAHSWRFTIILVTIVSYTYIWWYITRHFKTLRLFSKGKTGQSRAADSVSNLSLDAIPMWSKAEEEHEHAPPTPTDSIDMGRPVHIHFSHDSEQDHAHTKQNISYPVKTNTQGITATTTITTTTAPGIPTPALNSHSEKIEREIKKMLLLNGYPICYVILWIPGIANRIMEASGNTSNKRVLDILQASTQFVGFANAITYGLNQQWRGR